MSEDLDLRLRISRYLGGVRKLQKITQEQAAKDLGLSRPHLSNIEMGRSKTGWKNLRKMAEYYKYGIGALIEEVEAKMPTPSPESEPMWIVWSEEHGGRGSRIAPALRH